jgi:tRNA-2-methylthio-N6-dimethylallyladenosine synthase
MRFYLWTIGCQMNFADSRRLGEALRGLGYEEAERAEEADFLVLNTCVVRQGAEDKVRGRLTSLAGLKRRRPGMKLAVMGCFVGDAEALAVTYPWVDAFVAPSDVEGVVQLAAAEPTPSFSPPGGGLSSADQALGSGRGVVAAGVPISFGCDHGCTYCIVRLRRGREASRPVDEVVAEVAELARQGIREVTLLGQNVDSYGHDLGGVDSQVAAGAVRRQAGGGWRPDLADLLEAVHEVEGLARIRFLTSHPADMTERLIETAARLPRVCEHIELPVQSGDDGVLRRMGRGYTAARYRELVGRIRQAMPGVGLATDVIVGFPGETEAQFKSTYGLLEELRFDMVHVAAYSPRPGTAAARMADDVGAEEKERRRKAVEALQERVVAGINGELVGQVVEVLVEGRQRGRWRGRTRTNKLVFFEVGEKDWTGELVPVRLTWAGAWWMLGSVETLER